MKTGFYPKLAFDASGKIAGCMFHLFAPALEW